MRVNLKEIITSKILESKTPAYFDSLIKTKIIELKEGESTLSMVIRKEHLNDLGVVHGGVLSSFADIAMGITCMTYDKKAVTSDLHIAFIRPVGLGATITAEAKVINNGKSLIRVGCLICDETKKIVASADATFFVTGVIE